MNMMKNGEKWLDVDGKPIEAHGGCRLNYGGKIYWYGEDRTGDNYVSCYEKTAKGWKFLNNVLTVNSPKQPTRVKSDLSLITEVASGEKVHAIIERPKVLYCEKTGKFVMWMHYENGVDRKCARCAVATCDTPYGDFVYHGSFNPYGNDSRDCTLFKDGEKVYFFSSSRSNLDMHVYLLADDYLNVNKFIGALFSNELREAPAIIKKNGKYLIVTSYCTGWKPNQSTFSVSDSIDGVFSVNQNLGDENTYFSQSAFLYENEQGDIVYFGDRWGGNDFNKTGVFDYAKSGYCAYKIEFDGKTATLIRSEDAFNE